MFREDQHEERVDLGSATAETKGPVAVKGDDIGLQFLAGLSED